MKIIGEEWADPVDAGFVEPAQFTLPDVCPICGALNTTCTGDDTHG